MGLFDGLFKTPAKPVSEVYTPATEHEAWIALLLGIMNADDDLSDIETELITRQLHFKNFFQGVDIIFHYKKALNALDKFGSQKVILAGAALISEEYKPTVFSMLSEMIMIDGDVSDNEIKLLEYAAHCLAIDNDLSKKIIEVMQIRYFDNCIVIDS